MALGDAGVEVSEGELEEESSESDGQEDSSESDCEEDSAETDGEEDSCESDEAEDDKDGGILVVLDSEVEVTDPWLVSVPDVDAESISD